MWTKTYIAHSKQLNLAHSTYHHTTPPPLGAPMVGTHQQFTWYKMQMQPQCQLPTWILQETGRHSDMILFHQSIGWKSWFCKFWVLVELQGLNDWQKTVQSSDWMKDRWMSGRNWMSMTYNAIMSWSTFLVTHIISLCLWCHVWLLPGVLWDNTG